MRFATLRLGQTEQAAVRDPRGYVPVQAINHHLGTHWPTEMLALIETGLSPELDRAAAAVPARDVVPFEQAQFGPLYRHPRKLWGIGLNYKAHADDLSAPYPVEPASFMKNDNTIIGPGDTIWLPPQSQRVTGEAELCLVFGRTCKDVSEADAPSVIAGVTLVVDMTAEDILQVNPRFLTRAKNFDSFFSLGPELITLDEIGDIEQLKVGTYRNGKLHRENVVSNMSYKPWYLVSFHTHVATHYPGDLLYTGTPGAVVIEDGDVAECRIEGLGHLANPVRRLPG